MTFAKNIVDQAMAVSALAQLEIGRYHAEGRIVSYGLEEAFRWFDLAAKRNLPEAYL